MRCPSCSSAVADGRRFCPSCGTPLAAATGTRVGAAASSANQYGAARAAATAPAGGGDASAADPDMPATAAMPAAPGTPGTPGAPGAPVPYPDEPAAQAGPGTDDRTTRVLPAAEPDVERRGGRDGRAGERFRDATHAALSHAGQVGDRFRTAPADVRLAFLGTAVTLLGFLALPYADDAGTAAHLGGRLWWRPIAAVVATLLLAAAVHTARRRAGAAAGTPTAGVHDGARTAASRTDWLLAAFGIAVLGATEAGLVGLFSGDARGTRIGYYAMLAGLVTVLVATARAARRVCTPR